MNDHPTRTLHCPANRADRRGCSTLWCALANALFFLSQSLQTTSILSQTFLPNTLIMSGALDLVSSPKRMHRCSAICRWRENEESPSKHRSDAQPSHTQARLSGLSCLLYCRFSCDRRQAGCSLGFQLWHQCAHQALIFLSLARALIPLQTATMLYRGLRDCQSYVLNLIDTPRPRPLQL